MPNYDDLAQALASEGAAFGVFPQMGGKRKTQDVEAAKNIPVDILRGRVAGLLGAIPDLLNMAGRSPMPTETFGDTQYEPTKQLPYGSEHYLKTLPLAPTTQTGRVANEMGALVPLDPRTVVKAGKPVVSLLGNELARGMYGNEGSLANVIPTAMKPRFATEPQMQMAQTITKPKAEVSPLGFYSAVEQQALNIPRKQGTGESFLNDLAKGQDVKKYEMETMGLDEFLKGKPNVTRQEVQDFIANNRINVQEKILGGNEAPSQDLLSWMSSRNIMQPRNPEGWQELSQKLERYAQQHQKAQGAPEASQRYFTLSEEAGRISEGLDAGGSASGATKYQKYQLPGGENYREILLTLPRAKSEVFTEIQQKIKRLESMKEIQAEFAAAGNIERANSFATKANALEESIKELKRTPIPKPREDYKSSHFDEPNILAHMRVNDRVDAEGKKMLLIEEVQSDWHQAGREKGYQNKSGQYGEKVSPEEYKRGVALQNQQRNQPGPLTPSEQAELNDIMGRHEASIAGARVPDAPFKDTWHQLALKRAIKEAVDKGYDRIGLTTGAQQAERYNLSKQVDELIAKRNPDGSFNLDATLVGGGSQQAIGKNIPANKLPEYVGKDLAKAMETQQAGTDVYSGDSLKVGGEGMKKYYDEIYPNYLNKLGKKYGAQVGETRIKTGRGVPGGEPVRYLDITPEMRKAIKEGQPLASIEEELAKALA